MSEAGTGGDHVDDNIGEQALCEETPVPGIPSLAETLAGPYPEIRLVQGDLVGDVLVAVASRVDCIVNSANNHLLSRKCTGIAGALRKAGGPELQKASDEAKRHLGGIVPVGEAVWTGGGRLPCGVVHAVGLAYSPQRVLATPQTVRQSFAAALRVAAANGCRKAAVKLMCARPGYSTVPASDAPAVMLSAMLAGADDVRRKRGEAFSLEQVLIFVPSLMRATPAPRNERAQVLFSDSSLGKKGPLLQNLRDIGVEVLWRENVPNTAVLKEVFANEVPVVVTNQRRGVDGGNAGISLCRALADASFPGRIAVYSSHLEAATVADFWFSGACFVTHALPELEIFLRDCFAPGDAA